MTEHLLQDSKDVFILNRLMTLLTLWRKEEVLG